MGQQQLLLLVLGIVIVGLAVVAGIQAFAENQRKANADGLEMTSIRLAVQAQAWLRSPIMWGGGMPVVGDRPADFTGLTLDFDILGYPVNASNEYVDLHGTYFGEVDGANFVITATSLNTSGAGDNNVICVTVSGANIDDITTTLNPAGASCT